MAAHRVDNGPSLEVLGLMDPATKTATPLAADLLLFTDNVLRQQRFELQPDGVLRIVIKRMLGALDLARQGARNLPEEPAELAEFMRAKIRQQIVVLRLEWYGLFDLSAQDGLSDSARDLVKYGDTLTRRYRRQSGCDIFHAVISKIMEFKIQIPPAMPKADFGQWMAARIKTEVDRLRRRKERTCELQIPTAADEDGEEAALESRLQDPSPSLEDLVIRECSYEELQEHLRQHRDPRLLVVLQNIEWCRDHTMFCPALGLSEVQLQRLVQKFAKVVKAFRSKDVAQKPRRTGE